MSNKEITGTVLKCQFTSEWQNPAGNIVYYHDVTIDNGMTVAIGTAEKNAEKISQGKVITFVMNGNKAKLTQIGTPGVPSQTPSAKKSTPKSSGGSSKGSRIEEYLGYTWGYAKDLIIAGKTMKDVEELNKVARYIYEQVNDMLLNGSKKPEA